MVIQVVFGIAAAFAPEFWTFTFARLVIGMTTSGVFLVAYVIGKNNIEYIILVCIDNVSVSMKLTHYNKYLFPMLHDID